MIVTAALFCNDLLITLAVCSGQMHTIEAAVWTLLSLGVSQYSTFFKYLHDSAEQYYTHKSLEIAEENCIWAERTVEEHLI